MFDITSKESIINFAKKLQGETLRNSCDVDFDEYKVNDKGGYGKTTEKYYFKYEPNSDSKPDFDQAGLELKCSPLKTNIKGEYRSKERLVLNIINYIEVHKEEFKLSSFWKKNSHLLLVFYLHDKDLNLIDYKVQLVGDWQYPDEDLKVIKNDWEIINQKIRNGKAHELSEGDTFYLGACTKGATALRSLRKQPFNKEKAKQRAYSLKQGYVNHIIANIAKEETAVYGKVIEHIEQLHSVGSIEELVVSKFLPFYGKTSKEIETEFTLEINQESKGYYSNLTNAILGLELGQKIEEFEKANIQVKTVRLEEKGLPKEHISFPSFKYKELIETVWDNSDFKDLLESKFFFVFFQFKDKELILRKVKFWNMNHSDILEAKKVWEEMVETVSNGKIVKEVTEKGIRKSYFPKQNKNRVSHVRPHARNSADTYDLPIPDKLTGLTEFTKHCFWLNASYVKDEIYNK